MSELKTLVKVGGITNLSDARYCAGMGVDILGFNIDPDSVKYVSPEYFKEITSWISGVSIALETDSKRLPPLEGYDFEYIQISNPTVLDGLDAGIQVIYRVDETIASLSQLEEVTVKNKNRISFHQFDHIIDDSPQGIQQFDLFASQYPVVQGFGVSLSSIDNILASPVSGISMYGSAEEKPGYKSYDELADILEYLEREE